MYTAAIAACFEIAWLAREVRLSDSYIKGQVKAIVLPTQKLLGNSTAVANQLADVVSQENKSFAAQQAYFTKLGDGTTETFARVNEEILPRIGTILDDTRNSLRDTTLDIHSVLAASTLSVGRVAVLADAFTGKVNDPAWDSMLKNASDSMANLTAMSSDGKRMTNDAATFVHRELAPARGVKNTIKAGLDWAYKIRQLII